MAQTFARYCPRCGTRIQENRPSCPTCNLPTAVMRRHSPNQQSLDQAEAPDQVEISQTELINTSLASIQLSPSLIEPIPSEPQQARVTPMRLLTHIPGKRRMIFLFMLLTILLILGVNGYFIFTSGRFIQNPIKIAPMHIPFTYAGINMTLLSMQQAQNFVDDPHTSNSGMVRFHIQEQNTTTTPITWNYAQSAHLLVQGQAALVPVYIQSKGKIAPGATQTSLLDFAVPQNENVSNLSLQLGSSDEAQIRIPLAGQVNLSQYQPQTYSQHASITYFGLDWTLTHSTTSLSIPNQQAANGMEYLTLTMTIQNTLSQQAITGSPFDYVRVKIGEKIFNPVTTTLPISFASNHIENTGTVTFLIPQNSPSGTFLLLSQDPGENGQVTADFVLAHTAKSSGRQA